MFKGHNGKVFKGLLKRIESGEALTFMQFDPVEFAPEMVGKVAKVATENGLDVFAVGGSVGAQGELLDRAILSIKEVSNLPVILFPGNIGTISKHADAIYFMSLLNSNDPYYISGAQIASSLTVKKAGIEVIPTSYILIEPGRAAGWVGRAQLIPRNQPYLAAVTALAGQFMGAHLIILESGGGAPEPAPPEMVTASKELIDVPLLVAGGARTKEFAYQTIKAGADIVQIGSAFERHRGDLKKMGQTFKEITSAVKKAGKEKN